MVVRRGGVPVVLRALLPSGGSARCDAASGEEREATVIYDVEEEELRRGNFFLLDALLLVSLGTPHVYANLGSMGRTDRHADKVERGLLDDATTAKLVKGSFFISMLT